jgi:hypothetical protein
LESIDKKQELDAREVYEEEEEKAEDKGFYCYRRMREQKTKCCKQCEKTQ